MNQASLETASDDWFVDFDDDGLPDIAIGRLSVRTAAQADDVVAKIIGYDVRPARRRWTKDVLLVADQNDGAANFERSERHAPRAAAAGYTAQTVFRGHVGDAAAHQALLDGGQRRAAHRQLLRPRVDRIWGSNGELLTNDGCAGSGRTRARLPFVVAMNCLNGLFNGIYDEDEPRRGAAARAERRRGGGLGVFEPDAAGDPGAGEPGALPAHLRGHLRDARRSGRDGQAGRRESGLAPVVGLLRRPGDAPERRAAADQRPTRPAITAQPQGAADRGRTAGGPQRGRDRHRRRSVPVVCRPGRRDHESDCRGAVRRPTPRRR